ncbi:hypothetical protein ACFVAF_04230 [Streptomyces sp. NPDC057596]|uniref:hypothetical protein n=1 Tax=Streptomyces sp. NPDC057596 TaxID=3346178 RepID=UPI003692A1FF
MKLAMKDLAWHEEITSLARRLGWCVYESGRLQQRPENPSFMASRGGTVIAVWARSAAVRSSRMPPIDRYAGAGIAGYCWSPRDLPRARLVLMTAAVAPGGGSDGQE